MEKTTRLPYRFIFLLMMLPAIAVLEPAVSAGEIPDTPASPPSSKSPIRSEPEPPVDLLTIYRLAQENDPVYQSERYRHQASPEIYTQAKSELLPALNAGGYYKYTHQEIFQTDIAVYGAEETDYASYGYNLVLTQPIIDFSRFRRLSQAREEVKGAEFKFEAAKQALILRVADTYFAALEALENLGFLQAEEQAVKLHFDLAQERFSSGLGSLTDYHDVKARLSFTTAQRVRAQSVLADGLEALAELTGQATEQLAKLKYSLIDAPAVDPQKLASGKPAAEEMPLMSPDPDDIGNWIDAAVKQNIDIRVQRKALAAAKKEIERQKGGHYPTVNLVGRYNRDDEGGSLFGGSSDLGTTEAMVQLNIPLYQGGYVSSKLRESRKLYQAVEQDLEREVRSVKRGTKAAFLGVKSAIKNTEALRESVISHLIALEAKREGYRSGMFPSLVVLDAERDLLEAKRAYVRAQFEYILNGLRLKRAVGSLNETDLTGINDWLN